MHIGVDWGTDSSKTSIWRGGPSRYLAGRIVSSAIESKADALVFGGGVTGSGTIRGTKQEMLLNPRAYPFWGAQRADSHTSLGELVVLSLCCLISDALQAGEEARVSAANVDIGFSMPNWMNDNDGAHVQAAANFCQAAAVTAYLVGHGDERPRYGSPFLRETLKAMVASAVQALREGNGLEKYVPNWKAPRGDKPPIYHVGKVSWTFSVESCAAGLPYLRATPAETRIRKILVVDVGAGSTDVGYMLKTVTRGGEGKLSYFRPAATLRCAGNALTDEIKAFYEMLEGRPVGWDEAETLKLNRDRAKDWTKSERARDWRGRITRHVAEYMRHVKDNLRLFRAPRLEIALTGGSSVVPELGEEILGQVKKALTSRGVEGRLKDATALLDLRLPGLRFEDVGQYGRRAVSFGVADPESPGFREIAAIGPDPGLPERERFPTEGV
jgi:hypothetical protein